MPAVRLSDGATVNCYVDDYQWPWVDAVPAFMVHGFARSGRCWAPWVPRIAADRRVYRPEVRGCGSSPPPPDDFRFDAAALAEDLVDVMDRLELPRVHWVGEHSGSLLGMLVAAEHPDRIASLVLCDAPSVVPRHIHSGVYPLGERSTAAALRRYGVAEWCARTIDHRLDARRADSRLVEWLVAEMARTPVSVAAGLTECFGAVDVADRLEGMSAPALLLTGDGSDWVLEQQAALVRSLPDVRLHVFKGCGHGVSLLEPDACARAAVAFWDGLDGKEERWDRAV